MDGKLFFAAVLLFTGLAVAEPQWYGMDLADSFSKEMSKLQDTAHWMSDMLGAETKDRSREELDDEDDDDKEPANPDDSSQEADSPPTSVDKGPSEVDEDDDEDDEDKLLSVFHGFPNIFSILKTPAMKPWWEGPNVCVERDVKESSKENETETTGVGNFFMFGTAQFSSCKHSPNKYSCTTITSENGKTKTSTVTYQCCHGFRRVPGKVGCTEIETKPLVELAEETGCTQFASILKAAGIDDMENITVLVPTNEALVAYEELMKHENNIDSLGNLKGGIMTNDVLDETSKSDAGNKHLVLNHIITGLLETDDFYNDKVVYSMNDNSSLRINVFPGRKATTLTVNCAKLNVTDKVSTAGVVHTIEKVMTPVTKNVLDMLENPKYSSFRKLLEESDMLKKLEGNGPFTVLALTNDAMEKSKVSKMCLRRVLEHHILPHTVCSEAASQGKISALDLVADWLKMEKDEEGNLILGENVKATQVDILATNGVIHEVDGWIVPQAAKLSSELLQSTNHTKFLGLLERAGMKDVIDGKEDITLFVPSENGISSMEDALMEMNDAELKEILNFHIVPRRVPSNKLKNNEKLPTLLEEKTLPISIVSNIISGLAGLGTRALAQCSPLTRIDGDVCNGVVHEIAKVVVPPTKTIYQLIQTDEEMNKLKQVLEGTKLESELKEGKLEDVTFMAPTNDAFDKMGSGNLDILLKDKDLADQILRNHVLKGMVCCSGVGTSSWPFVSTETTISGTSVETDRSYRSNRVTFAGVSTKKCDTVTTDGLIHLLDGVILPAGHRRNTDIIYRRPHSEIILTGF